MVYFEAPERPNNLSIFGMKVFFFFFPIGKKPIRIISLSTKISEVHINMLFWCDF